MSDVEPTAAEIQQEIEAEGDRRAHERLEQTIAAARAAHSRAQTAVDDAAAARLERDRLLVELHRDGMSYGALAREIGLTRGAIALICREPLTRGVR